MYIYAKLLLRANYIHRIKTGEDKRITTKVKRKSKANKSIMKEKHNSLRGYLVHRILHYY